MSDFLIIFLFIFFAVFFFIVFFLFYKRKIEIDKSQSEAIKDLERRLTDLMISQLKEIRDTQNGVSREMHSQIQSFTKETVQIREDLKQIQEKVKDVSSFQEIFKSPKLRGQWGEASLEHILSQHFPKELYQRQYLFPSGEQVDFVLKLPNGRILPIDSKFSSENFERMIHSNDQEKEFYRQEFLKDVKKRIDEVSRKYILPQEGTVDFALMYIPAEAIYYEIVFHLREEDISKYAWSKKVVLTSPNTIYLTLKTIEHWFRDTQISKKTQEILKRLAKIYIDSQKLMNDFRKLGNHLKNATSAYESSEKRLFLFSERVERLTKIEEPKKLKGGNLEK
jgi:DNA recombination protein RmuC